MQSHRNQITISMTPAEAEALRASLEYAIDRIEEGTQFLGAIYVEGSDEWTAAVDQINKSRSYLTELRNRVSESLPSRPTAKDPLPFAVMTTDDYTTVAECPTLEAAQGIATAKADLYSAPLGVFRKGGHGTYMQVAGWHGR